MLFLASDQQKHPGMAIAAWSTVIFLALLAYGYHLSSSNLYNQLPAVIALLNPELYTHDFYVQEMVQFTPRYYYYHLIAAGVKLGLSLPLTCFVLFFAAFSSFVTGLYAIGHAIARSRVAAIAFVFLGLAATGNGRIGFVDLFRTDPIPATLAMGIAIWGFYYCLRQRWLWGYGCFGLACLIQFLVGALPGMLMALPLLTSGRGRGHVGKVLGAFGVLAGLACLVYVPMLLSGNTSSGALSSDEFIHLYGTIRHPHHLIFSSFGLFGPRGWLNFSLFTLGGLLCIASAESLPRQIRYQLGMVVGVACALLVVNFVWVELDPVDFIAKLQLARTTPFAQLMILLGISALASEQYRQRNLAAAFLLIMAPVLTESGLLLLSVALGLWLSRSPRALPKVVRRPFVQAILLSLLALLMVVKYVIAGVIISLLLLSWRLIEQGQILTGHWRMVVPTGLFGLFMIIDNHYDFLLAGAIALPLFVEALLPQIPRQRMLYSGLATVLVIYFSLGLLRGLPPGMANFFESRVAIAAIPIRDADTTALAILGRQFRQISPPDALVLVPPQDETFRFYAQRAIVFSFKGFPFTDAGMQTWRERLEVIAGVDNILAADAPIQSELDPIYRNWSGSELIAIAQQFQADYVLTHLDWHPELVDAIVAQQESWIVAKVKSNNSEEL